MEIVGSSAATPGAVGGRLNQRKSVFIRRYGTLLAPIALSIYFALASSRFLTLGNFQSIIMEWTILCTLALGFTFVVAAGEFDLSFGYLIALCSVVAALMINAGINVFLVILGVLAIGAAVGILNSLLVVKVGLPAFIATIGVGALCQGVNYLFSGAAPIAIFFGMLPRALEFIGQEYLFNLPSTLLVFVPISVLSIYCLTQTRIGRYIYAIGMNPVAAKRAGINVGRGKTFAFVCCSVAAALVGLLITARSGSGQSIAGPEYLLDVFASVFFGMSLFKEGEANAEGTMVGALFMVIVSNGLTLMNTPFYILKILQGLVIFMSVSLTSRYKVQ